MLDETWRRLPQLGEWGYAVRASDPRNQPVLRLGHAPHYLRFMRSRAERVGVKILDHSPALELLTGSDGEVRGARGYQLRRSAALGGARERRRAGHGRLHLEEQVAGRRRQHRGRSAVWCRGGRQRSPAWSSPNFYGIVPRHDLDGQERLLRLRDVHARGRQRDRRRALRWPRAALARRARGPGVRPVRPRAARALATSCAARCPTSSWSWTSSRDRSVHPALCHRLRARGHRARHGRPARRRRRLLERSAWPVRGGRRRQPRDHRRRSDRRRRAERGVGRLFGDVGGEGCGRARAQARGARRQAARRRACRAAPSGRAERGLDFREALRVVQAELLPVDKNGLRSASGLEASLTRSTRCGRTRKLGYGAGASSCARESAAMLAMGRWAYASGLGPHRNAGHAHTHGLSQARRRAAASHLVGGLDRVWTRPDPVLPVLGADWLAA